jgi:hypothetical protein
MPLSSPYSSLSLSTSLEETSQANILSPRDIATLPDFFNTALPDVVLTSPEKEGIIKGSLHPGKPWVHINIYSFETFPLHVHHFNTEEGFRPLSFVCFIIQDKELYILGTAGVGEPVYRHLLMSYPC